MVKLNSIWPTLVSFLKIWCPRKAMMGWYGGSWITLVQFSAYSLGCVVMKLSTFKLSEWMCLLDLFTHYGTLFFWSLVGWQISERSSCCLWFVNLSFNWKLLIFSSCVKLWILLLLKKYCCIYLVCVSLQTACRIRFSHLTMWIPGWNSGMAACACIFWAILPSSIFK